MVLPKPISLTSSVVFRSRMKRPFALRASRRHFTSTVASFTSPVVRSTYSVSISV
ncbi:hypothetical protein D3C80_2134630 [compost metagenome]